MNRALSFALTLTCTAGLAGAQTLVDHIDPAALTKAIPALPPEGYYPPVRSTPEEHAKWLADRLAFKPIANILKQIDFSPAFSADPDAPNWYTYHGTAIPLRLWGQRIAVQFDTKLNTQQRFAILASAGLKPVQVEQGGDQGWGVYHLDQTIADCTAAKNLINDLLKLPGIVAASPVFHAPLNPALWLYPAAELSVQANNPGKPGADLVVSARPDLFVNDIDWAQSPGMMRVLSPGRNGFDTMKASIALGNLPGIAWSEPLFMQQMRVDFIPNDTKFGSQWQCRNTSYAGMDVGAIRAWNVANGSGIRTLVTDNGFQRNHPDVSFAGGRDFTDGTTGGFGDGSPGSACDRHGTACAGLIAATANNNLGVAGIAYGGQTYVARIMYNNVNADGSCAVNAAANAESATGNVSWTVNGMNWGATNGVRICSQSIGFGGPSTTYETAATNLHNNGMSIFVSTGNDGSGSIGYPSSVFAVQAIGAIDITGNRASYSQYGTGIDFVAPATGVWTTDRTGSAGYNMSATDGDSTSFSGTSAACPVAAGAAALALSSKPWLTAGAMEFDLTRSTTDRGATSYDTVYGWGIINAYKFMVYPFETQANDACGNATNLGSGTTVTWSQNVTSAIDDAVAEPQESCEAGNVGVFHSVWFTYTAPTFGTINLNTNGSNYDTVLSVWDGCGVYNAASDTFSPPAQLGCNDDIGGGNLASSVTGVSLVTGQTVRIKVSRYGRAPATTINSLAMTLNINFIPGPPTNNACNRAQNITFTPAGGLFYYESPLWDTTQAANLTGCSSDTPATCVTSTSKPVWWSFTAPGDGVMLFQTIDSNYDTVLSLYSGCGRLIPIGIGGQVQCFQGSQLACNDDVTPSVRYSEIGNFSVTAGTTYKIRLAGYGAASTGGLAKLRVYFNPISYPVPANDSCANATVIPGASTTFTDSVSTMGATTESDCGDPPANTLGTVTSRSVWWKFTPDTDGLVSIDTLTSNFDTTMTIYDATNTGCAGRVNGACVYPDYVTYDEDSGAGFTSVISNWPLVGGRTYLFRVAGYGTTSRGTANFNFSYVPSAPTPPANDAWAAAMVVDATAGTTFSSPPIDTRNATSDTDCGDGASSCVADPLSRSIWFSITPTTDGFLNADTLGSDYDTVLVIYDGTDGGPTRDGLGNCLYPPEVACNDDSGATPQSALSATLLRGRTYLIAVYAKDTGGQAMLQTTFTAACAADIAGLGGSAGPDGALTVDDVIAFLSAFFANDLRADIATLGGTGGPDGSLTVDDVIYFLGLFFNNCQ